MSEEKGSEKPIEDANDPKARYSAGVGASTLTF